MDGRERVGLTMKHREPDRVPVQCQLSVGHLMLNTKWQPHEIWYETEAIADALIAMARRYSFDGMIVLIVGHQPGYFEQNVERIGEKQDDGYWVYWKNGDRTWFVYDDFAHHHPANESKPQRADFHSFDPDRDMDHIDDYLGYTWNVRHHIQEIPGKPHKGILYREDIPDYYFRTYDLMREKAPDLALHGSIYSPLTHYFELFGYESALMSFIEDPGKAHAVLERFVDHVSELGLAYVERGVDGLDLSSAFVAAPFLSRAMYKEFVVPYERAVNDAIHAAGGVVYTHTCGSIGDRLDLMVETHTDGVDTLDPPPLGDGDLEVAKRDFGDDLFFKGNLDSVALLQYKTEQEVEEVVKERLRIGKPGAGYILDVACAVAPHVEPWKLEMFTPLAEEFGRYDD